VYFGAGKAGSEQQGPEFGKRAGKPAAEGILKGKEKAAGVAGNRSRTDALVDLLVSALTSYERLPAGRRLEAAMISHHITFGTGELTAEQIKKLESVFENGGPAAVSVMANVFGLRGMYGSLAVMRDARDRVAGVMRAKEAASLKKMKTMIESDYSAPCGDFSVAKFVHVPLTEDRIGYYVEKYMRNSKDIANINAKIAMLETAEKTEKEGIYSAGLTSKPLSFAGSLNTPAMELCKMGEALALELETRRQVEDLRVILSVLNNNYRASGAKYRGGYGAREYDEARPALLAFFGALLTINTPEFADPKLKDRPPVPHKLLEILGETAIEFISNMNMMRDLDLRTGGNSLSSS
jgi:hypothetical protein